MMIGLMLAFARRTDAGGMPETETFTLEDNQSWHRRSAEGRVEERSGPFVASGFWDFATQLNGRHLQTTYHERDKDSFLRYFSASAASDRAPIGTICRRDPA